MSDKIGDDRDPYLYPGLNVMRNRLGIHQIGRLEQAAYELTALRAATIELGRRSAGCLICVRFIVSFTRTSLTGRVICVKWISIRVIPVSAISLTSKKRGMP